MEMSPEGWNIAKVAAIDWTPWGSGNNARAKVLGSADEFFVAVVEASPGYRGDPHVHDHPEFLYVLDGVVRTQGETLEPGDGYAAAAGSRHDDFGSDTGATYLSIFKL
jgi:quercetin dioxygenase-like cupin family protein